MSARWQAAWLLCLVLTIWSSHAQLDGDIVELDALLDAAVHADLRNLLQAAGAAGDNASPGGYGGASAGGYGGQEAGPAQQQCTTQVQPSNMQVFTAMLEPVNAPQGQEAAQDAPRGMATVYVDPKSGQMYVTGSVNNIHNLTAVTLNAGNSTQVGPVLLPLLPSANRVNASQGQASGSNNNQGGNSAQGQGSSNNNQGGSQSQGGSGSQSVTPFSPPLPWLTSMEFSEVVPLSGLLPLTSNATLNTSQSYNSAQSSNQGTSGQQGAAGQGNQGGQQTATQANEGVPLSYSGNLVAAKPFSFVDVNALSNRLSNNSAVTVVSVYMPDGTVVTSYNFSNTNRTNSTGAGASNADQSSARNQSASGQGSGQNQNASGVVSPIPLMQAGLAYISVHTSQSGQSPELRGQLIPYGKVVGNSAAIANAFPDALAPTGSYVATVCRPAGAAAANAANATSTAQNNTSQVAASSFNAANTTSSNTSNAIAEEAGQRAQNPTGANLLQNATYTNLASQVLPAVRAAMNNVTSGNLASGRKPQGDYSTFAAAVQAAEGFFNQSRGGNNANSNAGGAAGSNNANSNAGGQGANGRHLMQATTSSSSSSSSSSSASASNTTSSAPGQAGAGNEAGTSGGNMPQAGSAGGNASMAGNERGARGSGITVFAPTNEAIQNYLQTQGITQQQLLSNQSRLLELISYHIVPTMALSSQNLASRKQGRLQSLLPNNNIGFRTANNGSIQIMGANNTANVTDANIGVGRVWMHGIDQVLIPPAHANTTQSGVTTEAGAGSSSGAAGNAQGGNTTTSAPGGGSRRLQRRLFMLAHKAHLL